MAAITDDRIFRVRRNLSDAGCDGSFIEKFLLLEQRGQKKEQLRLLAQHRLALLEDLHRDQYRIDCLDYLVYTMEKEITKGDGG